MGTAVSIYSHLQDGTEQLGIQGLNTFNDAMSIPFGFSTLIDANDDQLYTISLSNIQGANLENATVFITDNELGITTNLSLDAYTFYADAGTYDGRFTVHFETENLGVTEINIENIAIYPNPTKGVVTIKSPNATINSITIFDLNGRKVLEAQQVSNNEYRLNLSELKTSIYYATIKTESGTVTKKIIKN